MVGLLKRLAVAWRRGGSRHRPDASPAGRFSRGAIDHVVLLDGTMGSLASSNITSIGLLFRYLRNHVPRASLYYGKGLQYREWRDFRDVWLGWGVDAQILRAYGWLAMRYRPGDRIFLIGYSRGAFAVRSLAGLIERVGLLRAEEATERNVNQAWRHYEGAVPAEAFRTAHCHEAAPIEMVGVFDTVAALGVQLPLMWMFSANRYEFHDHHLGAGVRHGFQALALHETRSVLEPLIWDCEGTGAERIEQVWFRGCHADIGGQLGAFEPARPLANIPLVWMLDRAEGLGLALPPGWRADFVTDPTAPSVGSWSSWGKFFLFRAPRVVGRDASERIHETAFVVPREWWLTIRPWLAAKAPAIARPRSAGSERLSHDEAGGGADGIEPPVGNSPDLAARHSG